MSEWKTDTLSGQDNRTDAGKPPLVVLTGPTAVGKTALSIALAKRIGAEIISADSVQVYRHMDIGSAKIMPAEMDGVRHHLIDLLEPWEDFNVVTFQKECLKAMEEIYRRGHIPLLVGGTGFYIQAILRKIDFTENDEDVAFRREMEAFAAENGAEALHERLKAVDPEAAEAIPPGNIRRVVRALEFHEKTGEKISVHNEREKQRENAFRSCYFVLNDDRDLLYQRIEKRVDDMLEAGLVNEVKTLLDMGVRRENTSMQALGYKEIAAYLNGEIPYAEAVAILKRDTRHFAKRQLTWFRRESDVIWLNRQDYPGEDADAQILQEMLSRLSDRGII